tara:strand:+ start:574 stop:1341 length:768 start_codon:yes stop_codon:yes gene_type:complete
MEKIKREINTSFTQLSKWKRFNNFKMNPNFKILKRIGSPSVYGSVYELDKEAKYVLKIMKTPEAMHVKMFNHEITAGKSHHIEICGVRIHAYIVLSKNVRAFVMDHVLMGNCTLKAISLRSYIKPTHDSKLYNHMAKTLNMFYKITQGFHGDLHLDNIMVVTDSKKSLKYVKIIDYGTWTPFQHKLSYNATLKESITHVHKEWLMLYGEVSNSGFQGIPMKSVSYGLVRSNKHMLNDGMPGKRMNKLIDAWSPGL